MAKNGSSGLGHVVMLLLLLTILFHYTESALPSDMQQFSLTGRRMMAYYKPNGIIRTPPSESRQGPGRHDRKLMSIYKPNGDIYTGPSNSGHGGGHVHQSYSP